MGLIERAPKDELPKDEQPKHDSSDTVRSAWVLVNLVHLQFLCNKIDDIVNGPNPDIQQLKLLMCKRSKTRRHIKREIGSNFVMCGDTLYDINVNGRVESVPYVKV